MNHSIQDELSILMAVVFIFGIVLLSIVIWSIRRHRDPKLHIECASPIDQLIPSLAGLTLSKPLAVIRSRSSRTALFSTSAAAHSISSTVGASRNFSVEEGVLGHRMADALSERARAGKQVRAA